MPKRILGWTAVAGFGLAGQFDSVVLHHLLKWHHLMSLAAPGAGALAQAQWDSTFDTAMFAVLVLGLTALLVYRNTLVRMPAALLAGAALAGFGLWHVTDAVVVHWALGWHRVHPASPHPLFWDLLWLTLFGIAPLVLSVPLLRSERLPPRIPAPAAASARPEGTPAQDRRFHGTRRKRKGPPDAR